MYASGVGDRKKIAFDSILPMFYFRQLMSDERFPDTIQGIAVTPKMVQTENFNLDSE